MRDDEIRRYLRSRNPWWKLAAAGRDPLDWIARDSVLQRAEEVGINYSPTVLGEIVSGGLYVVRGPRRVPQYDEGTP